MSSRPLPTSFPGVPSGSVEEGLLHAIMAEPDEDAPRLIYADWLEEQGDSDRAEFIRLQCQWANPAGETQHLFQVMVRVKRLEAKHGRRWKSAYPEDMRDDFSFHRGLLTSVTIPGQDFPPMPDFLVANPLLHILHVDHVEPEFPTWNHNFGRPWLRQFTHLNLFANRGGDQMVAALCKSPYLHNLRSLDLSGNEITDAGAVSLAATKSLPSLVRLSLRSNRLQDDGAKALAGSSHRGNLQALDLSWNYIGDVGATALAKSWHLAKLEALDLSSNPLHDTGLKALAKASGLPALRRLFLCSLSPISKRTLAALRMRFPEVLVSG